MTLLLVLWLLAQREPKDGECNDRRPGIGCVEYTQEAPNKVTCVTTCYYKERPDGTTRSQTVRGAGTSENRCLAELVKQCGALQCQQVGCGQ